MNLEISLVPYGQLTAVLHAAASYLEEAAARTKGRCIVDDIVRLFFTGQYTLWIVFAPDAKAVHGCFVTEVVQYPQCKVLTVQHAAVDSQHMLYIEDKMQATCAKYAADAGCASVTFVGRPGWKRHAEKYGYTAQSVAYTKFIDKVPA